MRYAKQRMTKEELDQRLEANGLGLYRLQLSNAAVPTVRLRAQALDESKIPIGKSKIGGLPDVPRGFAWPQNESSQMREVKRFVFFKQKVQTLETKPLAFLAQINLAEATLQDVDQALPATGMLYFFYCAEQSTWGFEPTDKLSFRVMYADVPTSALQRQALPKDLPKEGHYKACEVTFQADRSIPGYHSDFYDFLSSEEQSALLSVLEEGNVHKLLGYPDEIQGEMEWDCALTTHGISCGSPAGYNSAQAIALKESAQDWRLLFQLDSEDDADMMWGDSGRLYFWIQKADLAAKRFDRCWMILQCC
jgi:uncharacterized protein YwqG